MELIVNRTQISNGTTLYVPVGRSLVVTCRRCSNKDRPSWLNSDGSFLPICNDTTLACSVKARGNRRLDLRLSSFSQSVAGVYTCTAEQDGTVMINVHVWG